MLGKVLPNVSRGCVFYARAQYQLRGSPFLKGDVHDQESSMEEPERKRRLSRKELRESVRQQVKTRQPAAYWLERANRVEASEPEFWDFCAREIYGVSLEDAQAGREELAREKIGDELINLNDFVKVMNSPTGKTTAQVEAEHKRCREMYAEWKQSQA